MKIDKSRYNEFWRNPERYRLIYEVGLVPAGLNYSLSRGIAFHTIANMRARGFSEEEIDAVLGGEVADETGRKLQLAPKAIEVARVLWKYTEENSEFAACPVLASELEFEFPLADSPHSGVGRLDRIIEYENNLWLQEFKTTSAKKKYDVALDEWQREKQADFEILGARAAGYDVAGVIISYVVESVPPKLFPPIKITRTAAQLTRTILEIHETCEIIELLKRIVGTRCPWPHVSLNWPCSKPGMCEYETVCGCADPLANGVPEGFEPRREHLVILNENRQLEEV